MSTACWSRSALLASQHLLQPATRAVWHFSRREGILSHNTARLMVGGFSCLCKGARTMCTIARFLFLFCLSIGAINARSLADENLAKPKTITLERTESVAGQKATMLKWYIALPGKLRRETSDGSIVVITDHESGRTVALDRKKKTATITETIKSTKEKPVDLFTDLFDLSSDVRAEEKDTVVVGRRALAFETQSELWSRITWVDETSRRPVRVKYSFRSKTQPASEAVLEKFQYDSEFDESLFDPRIPSGYTVVKHSPADTTTNTFQAY